MLSELFATAPDAMIVVDAHGRIIRANLQTERIFGYSEDELCGQPVEILIPEQLRQVHRLHRAEYAANPRMRPMGTGQELVGLKRDGRRFPVEIALSPVNTAAGRVFIASIRDISETQRVRQALLRATYDAAIAQVGRNLLGAANLDAAAPTLQLITSTLGLDAAAIVVKQSLRLRVRTACGIVPEHIDGLPWRLVQRNVPVRGDGAATEAKAPVNDSVLAEAGFESTFVFPLFDADEPTAALLIMSRVWRDLDGDASHFLESAANLLAAAMQRIRTEEQLSHAQRLEAIGQLTGGVAHDFNNLLTVIAGSLQILEDRLANRPDDLEVIRSAMRAAGRGAELTRKLLAFARQQQLSPRACDPKTFLNELGAMLRRTLGETIAVRIECEDGLPPVFADPAHLDSALVNLALNARDAMPRGGVLSISATARHFEPDPSAGIASGDYVVLAVRDTGTGMSSDVLTHAFEPFFTTKEHGKGSGLGLSMVYGFVKQSGGHLTVDSRLGYGTSIELHLPAADRSVLAEGRPRRVPAGGDETILVVEDETDVRHIAVAFLRSLGYNVRAVPTAEAAIDELASDPSVTMVFSDLVLGPGMNGRDLALKLQREQPHIPVLLTSGYASSPDPQGNGEPYEVLQKPYRREELALAVRRTLDSWSARSAQQISSTDGVQAPPQLAG